MKRYLLGILIPAVLLLFASSANAAFKLPTTQACTHLMMNNLLVKRGLNHPNVNSPAVAKALRILYDSGCTDSPGFPVPDDEFLVWEDMCIDMDAYTRSYIRANRASIVARTKKRRVRLRPKLKRLSQHVKKLRTRMTKLRRRHGTERNPARRVTLEKQISNSRKAIYKAKRQHAVTKTKMRRFVMTNRQVASMMLAYLNARVTGCWHEMMVHTSAPIPYLIREKNKFFDDAWSIWEER